MIDDCHVEEAICRIRSCGGEVELQNLLRTIIPHFGVENYVFVFLERDSANREHYRYFIGCSPEWCQLYNAHKWFACDPFIEYARHNSEPILGSQIRGQSEGQRQLLAAAAEHGFRSGVIVPVHSGLPRIGVLYLGSSRPPEEVEPGLREQRIALRGLAFELFEWWIAKRQAEVLSRVQIDRMDLELLRYEAKGFTSKATAQLLGLSPAQINRRFLNINRRLGVHNRREAAQKASELGLLREH